MLDLVQERRSFLLEGPASLQINTIFGCAPTFLHCVLVAGLAGKARRVASWWDLFDKLDRIGYLANLDVPRRGGSLIYRMGRPRCAPSAHGKKAHRPQD